MRKLYIIIIITILLSLVIIWNINSKIYYDYENRSRHIHKIAEILHALRSDIGGYPANLEDSQIKYEILSIIKIFESNLSYESDGTSFKICEKEPRRKNLFTKHRLCVTGYAAKDPHSKGQTK